MKNWLSYLVVLVCSSTVYPMDKQRSLIPFLAAGIAGGATVVGMQWLLKTRTKQPVTADHIPLPVDVIETRKKEVAQLESDLMRMQRQIQDLHQQRRSLEADFIKKAEDTLAKLEHVNKVTKALEGDSDGGILVSLSELLAQIAQWQSKTTESLVKIEANQTLLSHRVEILEMAEYASTSNGARVEYVE